ncbi:MAG: indolepyruvate ferredoxin oxidoreductase subunit alpha [Anaerovoracaceae bacterium]|jgi:NAD-dependent dihydropyrimidine dehydrogenase PreA subunit
MALPKEDVLSIFRQAHVLVDKFDREKANPDMSFREKLLINLEEPYGKMFNEDEMRDAINGAISETDAEIWFAFPDFDVHADPVTIEEAKKHIRPELYSELEASMDNLRDKNMLLKCGTNDKGEGLFMRSYLFDMVQSYVNYSDPHATPMGEALLRWWIQTNEGGSKDFPRTWPPYRIPPHEGTLTGKDNFGKVPMNLEIPDKRDIVSMDMLGDIFRRARTLSVTTCICRVAQEKNGTRKCDFPLDVCISFNEEADGVIAAGVGRQITADEAIGIVKKCHEIGMMQIISNTEDPLALCNCCRCCCGVVKSMARFETTIGTVSRYLATVADPSRCIGCKTCVRMCPRETIKFEDGKISIFEGNCFGCGLCVSKCPKGALKMKKRTDAVDGYYQKESEPRSYM